MIVIFSSMGISEKTGKAKTMFRPYRHMVACGIREVIKWAKAEREQYGTNTPDLFDDGTGQDCDTGMCGT